MTTIKERDDILDALCEVGLHRERQIEKGFTHAHDDEHSDGSLISFAASILATLPRRDFKCWVFPAITAFGKKGKSERDRLLIASAVLVAEVERRDRLTLKSRNASELTVIPAEQREGQHARPVAQV